MPETSLNPAVLPLQTRVSLGTAILLGLLNGKMDAEPTTAYLMTYKEGKCTSNCGFCPQAQGSKSSTEMLSRVTWPNIPTVDVLNALAATAKEGKIKRVCIQALNYPDVFRHLEALVKEIRKTINIPVSVSCQPIKKENIITLKNAGVNRIGIALDGATKKIFNTVKGAEAGGVYSWEGQFCLLEEALSVFGFGDVSTHLIVGLGETEQETLDLVQRCVDMGVLPALFAFTPLRGTSLEKQSPPQLESYRRIQLARYLIVYKKTCKQRIIFDVAGKIVNFGCDTAVLEKIVSSGEPFQTSGCPDCNRPFYNEKPSGPIFNYPKKLSLKEIDEIKRLLKL